MRPRTVVAVGLVAIALVAAIIVTGSFTGSSQVVPPPAKRQLTIPEPDAPALHAPTEATRAPVERPSEPLPGTAPSGAQIRSSEPSLADQAASGSLPPVIVGWLAEARRVGRACRANAQCGRWQRCRLGLCMNSGAACSHDADCGTEARCDEGACAPGRRECTSAADCPVGTDGANARCVIGECWPEGGCTRDAQCGAEKRCFIGSCLEGKRECVADGDCPDGRRCDIDRCSAGARECLTDADCGDDARCALGTCAEGATDCDSDEDCASGESCSFGRCG